MRTNLIASSPRVRGGTLRAAPERIEEHAQPGRERKDGDDAADHDRRRGSSGTSAARPVHARLGER